MSNEEIIWAWLEERIGNRYGVAGLMGNLQAESGLRPNNLENRYADASGWTDEGYTAAVDCGAISREMFQDGAGYGLAQWTYWSRKRDLYDYAKKRGVSIGDLGMQLEYLWAELKQYGAVLTAIMNAKSVKEASDAVLVGYEKPANQTDKNKEARAKLGQAIYDRQAKAGEGDRMGVKLNEKAEKCVKLAEERLGDPYVYGAWGDPCTVKIRKQYAGYNPVYKENIFRACPVLSGEEPDCGYCKWNGHLCYDCRGFTYSVLKTAAGINLQGAGATSQYDRAENWEEKGNADRMPNVVCCVFKYKDGKMSHTGLHIGDGMIIHCSTVVKRGAMSDTTWTHYAVPAGLYTREELKEAGAVKMKPTLKSGSSGDAVRELQEELKALGFDLGETDGKFGPKTKEAVMAFQMAYGLTADGIVGGVTWQEIEKQQSLRNKKDKTEQDKAPPAEKPEEPEEEAKEEERMIMFMLPEKQVRELFEYLKKLLGEGD